MIAAELEALHHAARHVADRRVQSASLVNRVAQRVHRLDRFERDLAVRLGQHRLDLLADTREIVGMRGKLLEEPGGERRRRLVPGYQQNVQLAEQFAVGERRVLLIARLDEHAQDIIGGGLTPLRDLGQQHLIQFFAYGHHAREIGCDVLLVLFEVWPDERVEQLAQMVDLGSGAEADEALRRHVEGDLARLFVDIDLAARGPVAAAVGDHLVHHRQVAAHVGQREGGIHQLALPCVLGIVGVEQSLLEDAAQGG